MEDCSGDERAGIVAEEEEEDAWVQSVILSEKDNVADADADAVPALSLRGSSFRLLLLKKQSEEHYLYPPPAEIVHHQEREPQ